MASAQSTIPSPSKSGPAWEIATLFPDQGDLSESDYLLVTEHTNRLAEFSNGHIEVLPMPTLEHQEIVLFLVNLLRAFIAPKKLGRAIMSPIRVRLADGRFREPDVIFMLAENSSRIGNRYWESGDLVVEVVSEDEPKRDLVHKREDYAASAIPEYWIVDPRTKTITVLKLSGPQYIAHDEATGTGVVRSALLDGFAVDVAATFAAGAGK